MSGSVRGFDGTKDRTEILGLRVRAVGCIGQRGDQLGLDTIEVLPDSVLAT